MTTTVARPRDQPTKREEEEEEEEEENEEERAAREVVLQEINRKEREDESLGSQCAAQLNSINAGDLSTIWGYSSTFDHTNFEKRTGDENLVSFQTLTDYFMRPLSYLNDVPFPARRFKYDAQMLIGRLLSDIRVMIDAETQKIRGSSQRTFGLLYASNVSNYRDLLAEYLNKRGVRDTLEELEKIQDNNPSSMDNKFLKYFILGATNMLNLEDVLRVEPDPRRKINQLREFENNLKEALSPFTYHSSVVDDDE